jgi:hypothetical protein
MSDKPTMPARCNSQIAGYAARGTLASDEYKDKTATHVMQAVDLLSPEWRQLVNEYGYIETYLAWKRGLSPAEFERKQRLGFERN